MSAHVIIAGGGTGGHVFPALAIKQAIVRQAPGAQVIFAGTAAGLEAKVMPREHETLKRIWIFGLLASPHTAQSAAAAETRRQRGAELPPP